MMTRVDSSSFAPAAATPRSPWHSPVPYLFGGLAAMLGLIAFALLVLACSYWRLSGYLDHDANRRDIESDDTASSEPPPLFDEKLLVIMAGQLKPTFLATPVASRAPSFGSNTSSSTHQAAILLASTSAAAGDHPS